MGQFEKLNRTNQLKVCGLTMSDQIDELISINPDFLGFIFYKKSPRYVLNHLNLQNISEFNHQGKVGVFVNENPSKIIEIAEKANLNFIQLHGDENEDFISELRGKLDPGTKIIKVIRIGSNKPENLESELEYLKSKISYLLFDTDSKSFGGTGKQFDWALLNKLEIPLPYFLSGGISEKNIENLKILNQKPFALDINSKFEITPGIKDIEKIKSFKSNL